MAAQEPADADSSRLPWRQAGGRLPLHQAGPAEVAAEAAKRALGSGLGHARVGAAPPAFPLRCNPGPVTSPAQAVRGQMNPGGQGPLPSASLWGLSFRGQESDLDPGTGYDGAWFRGSGGVLCLLRSPFRSSPPQTRKGPRLLGAELLLSPNSLKALALSCCRPLEARDSLGTVSFHLQHLAACLTHGGHVTFVE